MDLDNYGPVPAQGYDYVVCSKCGSEFQSYVKECIDCGAPTVPPGAPRAPREEEPEALELARLPQDGVCPFCETPLPAGALECPGCGVMFAASDDDAPATRDLEIVQALYTALKEGDRDRVLEILDPQVEWIQNEGFPGGGRFVGVDQVYEKVFNRLAGEWEGWGAEVGRWLEADDSVVALGAYRGTFRKTGKSMRAAFAHVYSLRDGRIVRFEQYADTAKVAAACAE